MKKPTRSRRLRKKLYLDEFAILSFKVTCQLDSAMTEDDHDKLFDGIIEQVVDRNLCIGGGGDTDSYGAFITSNDRYGNASEEDVFAITSWLSSLPFVSNVNSSGLIDANYGDF